MSDHNTLGPRRTERSHDVLVRNSMEAVAPYSFVIEFRGKCEALRDRRHMPMECSIEAHHLGKLRRALGDGFKPFDCTRHMNGSERCQAVKIGNELLGDA